MIWQRVRSGLFPFIHNRFSSPIAADFTSHLRLSYSEEQRLGFFLRYCTSLIQPSKCSLKDKSIGTKPGVARKKSGLSLDKSILRNPKVMMNLKVRRAVQKVLPSVVEVSLHSPNHGTNMCSGIIANSDGTIITSSSVAVFGYSVSTNNHEVYVHPHPGYVSRTFSGRLLLVDVTHNIAIVKIKSRNLLSAAKISQPFKLDVGEVVLSLRSDFTEHGNLPFRTVVESGVVTWYEGNLFLCDKDLDCGPLINGDGELVGMSLSCYCTPADIILQMMTFAKKNREPATPWLGMNLKFLDCPSFENSCLVCKVEQDSPAHRAGIIASDVIMDFDGQKVLGLKELLDLLYFKEGKKLEVTLNRIGIQNMMKVTLRPGAKVADCVPQLVYLSI